MNNYEEQAARTMANGMHPQMVSEEYLTIMMDNCIEALQVLDNAKKALFYGKEFEGKGFMASEHPIRTSADIVTLHCIIGIATEAGELLEVAAKMLDGQAIDRTNVIEEIGDVQWYAGNLARQLGTTLAEAQAINIAKLTKRYPEKFTSEAAINRDVAAERQVLEGENKPTARLENWFVIGNCAFGDVVGHPKLGDTQDCRTSTILRQTDTEIETHNTIYKLGKPAE